jgi:hypothetical protein
MGARKSDKDDGGRITRAESESDFMTLREVADYLNRDYTTVFRMVKGVTWGVTFRPFACFQRGGFDGPSSRRGLALAGPIDQRKGGAEGGVFRRSRKPERLNRTGYYGQLPLLSPRPHLPRPKRGLSVDLSKSGPV